MRRPDALIFDLDGTLWDAAAATAHGWNAGLEALGIPARITVDGVRSVCGTPFAQCIETLLPELCPPAETLLQALEEHERHHIERSGGILYAGVAEGLGRLAAAYPLFLVSNCPGWYLDAFLHGSALGGCFTAWDCHGTSGLPKSGMLLNLAAGHRLHRAVYVGDTQGDREAACAAGMGFAHARYGFGELGPATDLEPERFHGAFDGFAILVEHFLARPC